MSQAWCPVRCRHGLFLYAGRFGLCEQSCKTLHVWGSLNPTGPGLLHCLVGFPEKLTSLPSAHSEATVLDHTSQSSAWEASETSGDQPPARAAHPALLECSHPHCLLACLGEKKISSSPKLNILQRGKLGWGNTWLWRAWGRGWQTGSEKAGKWKSPQLPASERHPLLLPGLPGLRMSREISPYLTLKFLNCHFHGMPEGKIESSAVLPEAVSTGLKK